VPDDAVGRPDDRLLRVTFWTAALIVPVLVTAFVILYGFPDRTRQLWAWTIHPSMTALTMGGGYLAGAWFFLRVATGRRWHRVAAGFPGTTVFTALLLGATLLHWDKFNHDHVSFWAWLALYVVTPVLLPWLWALNRRTDPGLPEARDAPVPVPVGRALAGVGALQLAVALAMFADPSLFVGRWPWALTPLTTRTLAAFIAFPAVILLGFAVDRRWSSFRIPMETVTLGLCLIGLAALRERGDFIRSDATTAVFATLLVGAVAGLVVLQLAMGRRMSGPAVVEGATTD